MNQAGAQQDNDEEKSHELLRMATEIGQGAVEVVTVSPNDISAEEELSNMCLEPRCAFYGLSANCPPTVPGVVGIREWQKNGRYALFIRMEVPAGSLLTLERLDIMRMLHEIVAGIERTAVQLGFSKAKGFAAGSCKELFCNEHVGCRVLTEGGECRNPEYARPSIEAAGINVYKLNQAAGWCENPAAIDGNTEKVSIGAVYGLVLVG